MENLCALEDMTRKIANKQTNQPFKIIRKKRTKAQIQKREKEIIKFREKIFKTETNNKKTTIEKVSEGQS